MEMEQNQLDEDATVTHKFYSIKHWKNGDSRFDKLDRHLGDHEYKHSALGNIAKTRPDHHIGIPTKAKSAIKFMDKHGKSVNESVERAAWVPESIADEQVEAFMEAALAAVKEGAETFTFEGKCYKPSKKESKLDAVGKEDDDVDNDGDVDSTDKYLHNRRKAIKKSMTKEEVVDEASQSPRIVDTKLGAEVLASNGKVAKFFSKRVQGYQKKAQDWMRANYDTLKAAGAGQEESVQEKMDPTKHVREKDGKYCVYNKEGKEVAKFDSESAANEYAKKNHEKLMEATGTAQHGPDAATSDSYNKQIGAGENDIPRGTKAAFLQTHEVEVALDAEQEYLKNKAEAENSLKRTPPRLGDQMQGDTSFVHPIKADIIDGITKALQQMKTNN